MLMIILLWGISIYVIHDQVSFDTLVIFIALGFVNLHIDFLVGKLDEVIKEIRTKRWK